MRSTVLGVAGGSGVGKTTLVNRVVERLGNRATVLWFDEYYHDLIHLDPDERATVNYDHPDSLDSALLVEHLDSLLTGRAVEVPIYDFSTHTRTGSTRRVDPRSVVVVDGILVLAVPEVRDRIDLAVFVDAPEQVRLGRRLERDVRERGRTPESVRAQFAATVAPMHETHVVPSGEYADLLLDGAGELARNVDMVVDAVDQMVVRLEGTFATPP
ncbi:MAG: uridine kinase [Acidimicrobiaceae bacterium]|nr:uridine kinase [Acidimicrobiaceae bacterium]HAQ22176.1 uridine kinase [Acidimicrobiaceae bacterium]